MLQGRSCCAYERFHRRFSNIDYDAREGFCVFEYRGEFSDTRTALFHDMVDQMSEPSRAIIICVA